MLTIAQLPSDLNDTCTNVNDVVNAVTAVDTLPSDEEISRRVLRIRSSWSAEERMQRRREAEMRFADLICKLIEADIAA